MAKAKLTEVDQDASVSKRRFDARDWKSVEELVCDEYSKRKNKRLHLEKHWADIDRQIAMTPNIEFKKLPNGNIDVDKMWMSEVELPLQAQALEVLKADARRLMFPDDQHFFRAHAQITDKYLQTVDFQSLILGDETEVPSKINQDNADKLVEGFLLNQFNQKDFMTRQDRINAEAIKYGMGVGRARMETKTVYIDEAKGVLKEDVEYPCLVPVSIKGLYLDDPKPSMHSAQVLGPAHIAHEYIKFTNLAIAANKGSTDPYDQDGGWMPDAMKRLVQDDNGYVEILEMEGDIVVPRKTTRSMVIPGAIVTVALGGKDGGGERTRSCIRMRFRKYPFSSYILFPYQYESADDNYPTSPLMKGRPIQILATEAVNRLIDSAALKNSPPVGWDKSDTALSQQGGPKVYPYAQWPTVDAAAIKVFMEVGGDPTALNAVYAQFVNLYAELTGVLPARLGAQTVSHTTAFAKDAELQRGAVRTVNYVNASGQGPIVRWLDMAYQMGRDSIKQKVAFHIAAYGGFVEVSKEQLPEKAVFEWLGSGGPQDENQKLQQKVNGLLLASKLDAIKLQTGQPPRIDYDKAIDEVLRESGWTDLDAITNRQSNSPSAPAGPAPAVAALQNLALPQPQ